MNKNYQESMVVSFEQKEVRKIWHNERWYFAIVDVVKILTDSVQPEGYIKDMRRRDQELSRVGANCHPPFDRNQRRKTKNKLC